MFRRKPPPPSRPERDPVEEAQSLTARLRALGALLEANHYSERGLCILAQGGGFVVTGFVVPERGAAYSLVHRTMEFDEATIASTLAQLREERAGV